MNWIENQPSLGCLSWDQLGWYTRFSEQPLYHDFLPAAPLGTYSHAQWAHPIRLQSQVTLAQASRMPEVWMGWYNPVTNSQDREPSFFQWLLALLTMRPLTKSTFLWICHRKEPQMEYRQLEHGRLQIHLGNLIRWVLTVPCMKEWLTYHLESDCQTSFF